MLMNPCFGKQDAGTTDKAKTSFFRNVIVDTELVCKTDMRQNLTPRERLCEQHLQMVNEISLALGEKDRNTQAHGHRVAFYAMRLARRLGFALQDIRNVGIGGLFHDVGKLALSDRITTNRDANLSSDLQQEVRCHPLIGAALLKNIDFLKPAVDFVLFHHEREDGNGYPFGLKATEIPPGAKIVSIADCFDAVTTDRPYHKGQPAASAYGILREGCCSNFSNLYVESFIEEIEENGVIQDTGPDLLLADKLVRSAAGFSAI
jgi:putative nucleotidyltransferase with HDIG domain